MSKRNDMQLALSKLIFDISAGNTAVKEHYEEKLNKMSDEEFFEYVSKLFSVNLDADGNYTGPKETGKYKGYAGYIKDKRIQQLKAIQDHRSYGSSIKLQEGCEVTDERKRYNSDVKV